MANYILQDAGSGPIYAPSVQPLPDGLFATEEDALAFAAGYAQLVDSYTSAESAGITLTRIESSSEVIYPIPE